MKQQLDALGMPFEWVDAVDGRALTQRQIAETCHLNAVAKSPQWLNRGAIGCALSHLSVYQKMIDDNIPFALVLEDDVHISESLPHLLPMLVEQLTQQEILLLYASSFQKIIFPAAQVTSVHQTYSLAVPKQLETITSAGAYLLSRKVAQNMANSILPIRATADSWGYYQKKGAFEQLRCVIPFPIMPAFLQSEIDYISANTTWGKLLKWLGKHPASPVRTLLRWKRKNAWKHISNYAIE